MQHAHLIHRHSFATTSQFLFDFLGHRLRRIPHVLQYILNTLYRIPSELRDGSTSLRNGIRNQLACRLIRRRLLGPKDSLRHIRRVALRALTSTLSSLAYTARRRLGGS